MISYFNIPAQALTDTPISKKLFAEKATLSTAEKRILREDIDRVVMKGLLQTRTIGIAAYVDGEFAYDQIVFAQVDIRTPNKVSAITIMIQRAFPVPMFVILHHDDKYSVNWCVKRINQADKSKRVMEEQQITRFFSIHEDSPVIDRWLHSLDITKINCTSLKDLFDELSNRLMMLSISDEAGVFVKADIHKTRQYRLLLEQLSINRDEQKKLALAIKTETQFNSRLKLTTKLKELQLQESQLKEKIH